MSTKKQDIADSWEEIDEERLVSAITILKNSTSPGTAGQTESPKASATTGNTARQSTLPQMLEEELRPKMVPRPMQILRRPQTSGGADGKSAADAKPKTQIKSLDQRRQEYAEARLRILGSAHDDEEAETKKAPPTTNGYRASNVNNNNTSNSSANTSSNSSASGSGGGGSGGSGATGTGDGLIGSGANNNANNMYRYHQPYRQQAPIGTFPPSLQNVPPGGGRAQGVGGGGGAPMMYFPTPPNQLHPHHPMQTGHPLHLSHQAFPPLSHHHHQHHHHHHGQQQTSPPHQHGSHPYPPQHFATHLNHQTATVGRDGAGAWFVGGRNGGNGGGSGQGGYYAASKGGGGAGGYGDGGNGQPPLLGLAPPGVIPYNGTNGQGMYGQASGTAAATPGGSNIVHNQHVLRLPAGPDGSQGFSMRR
uniref:SUZ RNA-binding domain-containing n=1 Tax=Anopheles dirus TaxID=7168 RepID=A0A182NBU4_9DIPT